MLAQYQAACLGYLYVAGFNQGLPKRSAASV